MVRPYWQLIGHRFLTSILNRNFNHIHPIQKKVVGGSFHDLSCKKIPKQNHTLGNIYMSGLNVRVMNTSAGDSVITADKFGLS